MVKIAVWLQLVKVLVSDLVMFCPSLQVMQGRHYCRCPVTAKSTTARHRHRPALWVVRPATPALYWGTTRPPMSCQATGCWHTAATTLLSMNIAPRARMRSGLTLIWWRQEPCCFTDADVISYVTEGGVTSQTRSNLWSRYGRHVVGSRSVWS